MNKLHLLQKLAPVGVVAISAIAVTGIATAPAQAATFPQGFHALGWDNGTSQFYNDAVDSLNSGAGSFSVDYCLTDCEADVSIADGEFGRFFDPLEIVPLASTPTATWQYNNAVPIAGFDLAAEFTLVDSPLEFEFISQQTDTSGQIVTATLENAVIEGGRRADDGALEFELISGEWEFTAPNPDDAFDPFEGTSQSSVFEFGITSADVSGGVYDAQGEIQHNQIPEPTTILGLLTISGLGLGLKRKKQLWKAS